MKRKAPTASSVFVRLLLSLLVVLTLIGNALAQGGSTGAISGTVKDEKGAAVAGAQVDIINPSTGVTERSTTSDGNGNFTVTPLPPELTRW